MRGINMHLQELFTAFGIVAGLTNAPPGEAASEGTEKSLYTLIVKIILVTVTLGWVLTGIFAKIAYDQEVRNQTEFRTTVLAEFKSMRSCTDTLLKEHEVVKANQARVLEDLKILHQTDEEMWRFLRGTYKP